MLRWMNVSLVLLACCQVGLAQAVPNPMEECFGLGGRKATLIIDGWESVAVEGLEALKAMTDVANAPKEGWKPANLPEGMGRERHLVKAIVHAEEYGLWYRRTLNIPEVPTDGRRLLLNFRGVTYLTHVWVNGRLAGTHDFPNTAFEVDITDLVKPGENEIIVSAAAGVDVNVDSKAGWPERLIGARCYLIYYGIWQPVYLVEAWPVRVQDICVRTSYREKSIETILTVVNTTDADWSGKIKAVVMDGDQVVLEFPVADIQVPAGKTAETTAKLPWENPKLWSPQQPHLYRLVATLEKNSQEVDRFFRRFGFREVWIDKTQDGAPKIMLNGQLLCGYGNGLWVPEYRTVEQWREYVRSLRAQGLSGSRVHAHDPPEGFLDAADEVGYLLIPETGIVQEAPYYRPAAWERIFDQYARFVIANRNHASLVIWSLDNEAAHCGLPAPHVASVPWLIKLCDQYHKLDPTRPVTASNDYDAMPNLDVCAIGGGPHVTDYNALPNDYRMVLHMFDDLRSRRQGKPEIMTEWGEDPFHWEAHANWLGERYYDAKHWVFEGYPWPGINGWESGGHQLKTETRMWVSALHNFWGIKEMRRVGIQFICSFNGGYGHPRACTPEMNAENYALAWRACPYQVAFNHDYRRNFIGGTSRKFGVLVINDAHLPLDGQVRVTFMQGGQTFYQAATPVKMARGERADVVVDLNFPPTDKRLDLQAVTELIQGDKVLYAEPWTAAVYPPVTFDSMPTCRLWDPAGKTGPLFDALRIRHEKAATLEEALANADRVLVLGQDAALDFTREQIDRVSQFVRRGGRVLIFPQSTPLTMLGGVHAGKSPRHKYYWDKALPYDVTVTWPTSLEHPVLAGTGEEDFRFWRRDNLIAPMSLLKPEQGNFRPLLNSGRNVYRNAFGMVGCPMLEIFSGQGVALLSQALLSEALEDPCAATVLRNALQYLETAKPAYQPVTGPLPPSVEVPGLVLQPESASGPGVRFIIAGAQHEFIEQVRAALPEVHDKGLTLVIRKVDPISAQALGWLMGMNLTCSSHFGFQLYNGWEPDPEKRKARPFVNETYPIVRAAWRVRNGLGLGQSSADLYTPDCSMIAHFSVASDSKNVIAYTDPCVLMEIPHGKGRVVIDQVRWDEVPTDRMRRYANILLTNLGLQIDHYKPGSTDVPPSHHAAHFMWYRFEDENGALRLEDNSGCGLTLVANRPSDHGQGVSGQSLKITGDFVAYLPSGPCASPKMTVDFYIKPEAKPDSAGEIFNIGKRYFCRLTREGKIHFGWWHWPAFELRSAALDPGRWTRVTITVDSAAENPEERLTNIYLDGRLDASMRSGGHNPWDTLRLGAFEGNPSFQGELDELRFLDEIVPPDQLTPIL